MGWKMDEGEGKEWLKKHVKEAPDTRQGILIGPKS